MNITNYCEEIGEAFYKAINGNCYTFYFDQRTSKLWMINCSEVDVDELLRKGGLKEPQFDELNEEQKIWVCTFEYGFETVRITEVNDRFAEWEKYLELKKHQDEGTLFNIDQKGDIIL